MILKTKKLITYLIPLILGLGLMNWVFNKVDFAKTLSVFKEANYFLVFVAACVSIFSHVLRAARWNMMLNSLSYTPRLRSSLVAVLLGYLGNLVLPRAGEVLRSMVLQKHENIPFDKSFGAVIAERVIDVVVLFILMAVNLLFEYERIYNLFVQIMPAEILSISLILFLIFFVALFGLYKYKDRLFEFAILNKFKSFFYGLIEGLTSIFRLDKWWIFIIYSFCIWGAYFIGTWILCQSIQLGSNLSLVGVLTILVMGTIGMSVPTLGGLGSYHLLVGNIVVLYGLSSQEGISLATFLHTLNGIVFVVIFGVMALLVDLVLKGFKYSRPS